jgi:hypothetical protein
MTSGDLEALAANAPARFAVVSKTEVDPDTGAARVLQTFPDYRLADLYRSQVNGKIRSINM